MRPHSSASGVATQHPLHASSTVTTPPHSTNGHHANGHGHASGGADYTKLIAEAIGSADEHDINAQVEAALTALDATGASKQHADQLQRPLRNVVRLIAKLPASVIAYYKTQLSRRYGFPAEEYRALVKEVQASVSSTNGHHGHAGNGSQPQHAPPDHHLGEVAAGALYYVDGAEAGIVLCGEKRERYLLRGAIEVPACAAVTAGSTGLSSLVVRVTPPGAKSEPVELRVTRDTAETGAAYEPLEGTPSIAPTSRRDREALYLALKGLAVGARRQVLTPTLGWYGSDDALQWVQADGTITATAVNYGTNADYRAEVPRNWPQHLPPEGADGQPAVAATVDANLIRKLLTVYGPDCYAMPALVGTLARVSLPIIGDAAGRLPFQYELVASTGSGKSSLLNWALRLFGDAGYQYDSPVMVSDKPGRGGDTDIGLGLKRGHLAYHGFLDRDLHLGPAYGPEWEQQQEYRRQSIKADRDLARPGSKSTRSGQLLDRPTEAGALLRTLESDPHLYSVPHGLASTDAGAVTFIVGEATPEAKWQRVQTSREIGKACGQLDRAGICWIQWLASQGRAGVTERLAAAEEQAFLLYNRLRARDEVALAHEQLEKQVRAILAGLSLYAAFLRECDSEAGTAPEHMRRIEGGTELADRLDGLHEGLAWERLTTSHALMQEYRQQQGAPNSLEALGERIRELIVSGLLSGEMYMTAPDDGVPTEPQRFGWRRATGTETTWQPIPGARLVGLTDGTIMGFLQAALFREVRELAKAEAAITISNVQMARAMRAVGLLDRVDMTKEGIKHTIHIEVDGVRWPTRRLRVLCSRLFEDDTRTDVGGVETDVGGVGNVGDVGSTGDFALSDVGAQPHLTLANPHLGGPDVGSHPGSEPTNPHLPGLDVPTLSVNGAAHPHSPHPPHPPHPVLPAINTAHEENTMREASTPAIGPASTPAPATAKASTPVNCTVCGAAITIWPWDDPATAICLDCAHREALEELAAEAAITGTTTTTTLAPVEASTPTQGPAPPQAPCIYPQHRGREWYRGGEAVCGVCHKNPADTHSGEGRRAGP